MSRALIARSPDLKRLQDEGYELEIRAGHLLVNSVPYVNSKAEVAFGTLVSKLTLSANVTVRPDTHVVMFIGDQPCNKDGTEIEALKYSANQLVLAQDLIIHRSFSNKPAQGYANYYDKMTRYIEVISAPAKALRPEVTAQTYRVLEAEPGTDVFCYLDTASSRAGIGAITAKLAIGKIAIVGLGGTGAYVLDLLAKTPVSEIHLYDGDTFLQHNAFRSPGAASAEELQAQPTKVAYYAVKYAKMHRGISTHETYITEENVAELTRFDFVFLCMDSGPVKRLIVEALTGAEVSFIDTGVGVEMVEDSLKLWAICRVTTSTSAKQDHLDRRISYADPEADQDYERNIQIVDLNALAATLAVIRWKKYCGFYLDQEQEHDSAYTTSCNLLTSEETP